MDARSAQSRSLGIKTNKKRRSPSGCRAGPSSGRRGRNETLCPKNSQGEGKVWREKSRGERGSCEETKTQNKSRQRGRREPRTHKIGAETGWEPGGAQNARSGTQRGAGGSPPKGLGGHSRLPTPPFNGPNAPPTAPTPGHEAGKGLEGAATPTLRGPGVQGVPPALSGGHSPASPAAPDPPGAPGPPPLSLPMYPGAPSP